MQTEIVQKLYLPYVGYNFSSKIFDLYVDLSYCLYLASNNLIRKKKSVLRDQSGYKKKHSKVRKGQKRRRTRTVEMLVRNKHPPADLSASESMESTRQNIFESTENYYPHFTNRKSREQVCT